jgi:hypothetical protein
MAHIARKHPSAQPFLGLVICSLQRCIEIKGVRLDPVEASMQMPNLSTPENF